LNTLWITGAGGLIGSALFQTASEFFPGYKVVGLTRPALDLTDFAAVRDAFRLQNPRLIIHCAALSSSVVCQSDPTLAHKVNVEVTALLAELGANVPFFFFSTDLVFDGRAGHYSESAPTNPLMVYGETKVAAERIVLANPGHTVIRTSLNGGTSPTSDRGFNEQLRKAWRASKPVKLFTDEFRSPIAASVTARAVWELAKQGKTGVYHVAGSERLSRWEIGNLIAARCPELNPKIEPTTLKAAQGAPRPADISFDCGKAQQFLSFQLPGLSQWLCANPGIPF
jgi:dTDP-4-dehydrorhamnose reductase